MSDTTGYPGWTGKHIFIAGMTSGTAALVTPGCIPHVETTWEDSSGGVHYSIGQTLSTGAFEAATWAGYYAKVDYVDMWVDDTSNTALTGTRMRVDPYGNIIWIK